ncbi:Hypothetical_protein [Hexamita inflata]|uniref:Hypothetical_protein n=1 Tax=Hexamita inflata TaxID=28002 RepID=A0AA86QGU4_9EUKA|nr:Hypothetical protein HINF_LOCUS11712 [Hexamita inflata]CAI9953027.1 Hypothetical protein HINF_LOCUS40672 [Hexamita inflata]
MQVKFLNSNAYVFDQTVLKVKVRLPGSYINPQYAQSPSYLVIYCENNTNFMLINKLELVQMVVDCGIYDSIIVSDNFIAKQLANSVELFNVYSLSFIQRFTGSASSNGSEIFIKQTSAIFVIGVQSQHSESDFITKRQVNDSPVQNESVFENKSPLQNENNENHISDNNQNINTEQKIKIETKKLFIKQFITERQNVVSNTNSILAFDLSSAQIIFFKSNQQKIFVFDSEINGVVPVNNGFVVKTESAFYLINEQIIELKQINGKVMRCQSNYTQMKDILVFEKELYLLDNQQVYVFNKEDLEEIGDVKVISNAENQGLHVCL